MKKLLSLLLCLAIVFSSMPLGVIAEDTQSEEPSAFSLSENQEDIIEEEPQEEVIEETIQEETEEEITLPEENIQVNQNSKNYKIEEENEEIEETFQLVESKIIDNIKITVNGTFAEWGTLSIKKVESQELSENNIAESHSFDIKVLNKDNQEIQPVDKIYVSFEFESISKNVDIEVYHEEEQLEAETKENVITVESDGFSIYTVEFTYENKQYVLEGDSYVKLSDILSEIGLTGEVTSYEVSNFELFDIFKGTEDYLEYVEIYDEEGNLVEYYPKNEGSVLYMVALQPFTTEEWLKVTIDEIEYTITVTDAIRVDENGSQVSTSVRYISTTSSASSISTGTNSAITDSRVIQGPTEENFTASMPLAEIYIDDTIVNQTLWRNDDLNGTRVIAELLVGNTHGKYKGFKINTDPEVVAGNSMASSYGALYYDFSERYFNDTQTLTVSGSSANNYEKFSGDIVKYTLKGMATKFDAEANEYKNYDVVITYSDLLITLAQNSGTGSVNQANISDKLMLIDTNMVNFKWSGGFRAGLEYNVNVKVVDPDTGELIDGSYYYPMTDIDIGRTGIGGFANLYNAANVSRYSEQVALLSNYGRPTSIGSWEQKVWIPGGNWSQTPVTNLSNITDEAFPYTSKISSKTIDGQANTLVIEPSRPNGGMTGAIATARGISPDNHDNSFYSGFITLANNTAGGINIKGWASAPTSGGVESYVLTGSQIVNHKVDASSNVGGTIFTTTTGNADGKLSGGTLLGYDEINTPFELSAATGQSVTYTMTPKGGYKLSKVWVKDTDIDIMSIVNTAKATIAERDFDENNDGELDKNEIANYKIAVNQAVNNALSGQDAVEVPISDLQSLGKGVYAYTFNGIQTDKSIHIEWEKTDLTVTKELSPTMSGITDKFKFQIKLSDTSTEETTWRVRAKKNTGKISYHNPYSADYVNTTYYFGYHEGHEETLPYSYVEVTETEGKNPYEEGWYIYHNGSYMPSYDTTVDESATYYERDDTQTSTITNYYYHLLGWNESTNSWEEKVIPATSGITDGAVLGTENLDTELPDYYRYNYDETVVNNENYYNEETGTYDKYLMWIPDTTTGKQMLVVGNTQEYPNGAAFAMGDYYAYIYQEGIQDYSGKVLKSEPSYIDINGVTYRSNFGGTGYWYTQDDTTPIYYNIINNSNGYNLDSGYTPLEGESGMYIITLPAGQTPNTDDLTADGWDVTESRVGAIPDDFDLETAMIDAGAKSVAGAVNTFEFELGVDETIDFNGVIPMGYNYEVTEILDSNGKWLKVGNTPNAVITDFDGDEHVTFTNTEKTFDVSIEKQTVDDIAGTFDFTIEIYKENIIPGQVQAITIQAYKNSGDTDVTYKLTNEGNPIDIEMNGISTIIPTGDSYLSNGGSLGTLIGDLITFNNTASNPIVMNGLTGEVKAESSISVYDEVQEVINEGNTSFSLEPTAFELKTPDIIDKIPYNPTTVPTGFSGSNGIFITILSNGDVKTFTNIPFGYKYEISETVPPGWENVSKTNETGTLTNADVVSTWVNKEKTYNLTINKDTVNNDSGAFNFEIKIWKSTPEHWEEITGITRERHCSGPTWYDGDVNETVSFITKEPGVYKVEYSFKDYVSNMADFFTQNVSTSGVRLNTNETVYITGGPINPTGYILETSDSVKMYRDDSFTDLIVELPKEPIPEFINFKGYIKRDAETKYIKPNLSIPKIDENNDGIADDGIYTFTLNNGESKIVEDIPYGYNYEIYEVDSQENKILVGNNIGSTDWKLKSIEGNNTGTITDNTEVTFTNELVHNLTIKKETVDNIEGTFNFRIKMWNETQDTSNYTYTVMSTMPVGDGDCDQTWTIEPEITFEYQGKTFEQGQTYELCKATYSETYSGGWSNAKWYVGPMTYEPSNRDYDVDQILASFFEAIEATPSEYTTYDPHSDSNREALHNTGERVIVNGEEYPLFASGYNSIGSEGWYTVCYGESPLIYSYIDVSQHTGVTAGTNNEYAFSLNNGESLTLSDLPHGVKYEVYEETKDGWKLVDINDIDPSINKGAGGTSGTLNEDTEEVFNNTPLYDIQVNKTVTGLKGDKNKDFEFTVKVWREYDLHTVLGNYLDDWRPVPVYLYQNMNINGFTQVEAGTNQYTYSEAFASTLPTSYKNDKKYTQYVMENGVYEPLAGYKEVDVDVVIDGVKYEKVLANADMLESNSWGSEEYPWFYILLDKGEEFNHTKLATDFQGIIDSDYDTMTIIDGYIDLSSYGSIDNGDGSYTFKLKDGEHFTLEDIPYGYTYEIVEKDYSSDLYTTTVDGANTRIVSGTVTSDKTHEYVNDKDYADLTITKNVTGNMGDKSKEFEFNISVISNGSEILYQNVVDTENAGELKSLLISEGAKTINLGSRSILLDIYSAAQLRSMNFYDATGTSSSDSIKSFIKNSEPNGNDIVAHASKILIGFGRTNDNYHVVVIKGPITPEYVDLSQYGGAHVGTSTAYKFTLKDGESIKITDIPVGYTYKVTEKNYSSDGYHTYIDNNLTEGRTVSGTLDSNKSHTYTNRYDTVVPTRVTATAGIGILLLLPLILLSYIIIRKRLGQR